MPVTEAATFDQFLDAWEAHYRQLSEARRAGISGRPLSRDRRHWATFAGCLVGHRTIEEAERSIAEARAAWG